MGVVTQVGFNGVVSGLIVGLLAMGIVLVYRATRVLNFAVGNIGLIGATLLSVLVVRYHVPFWVAAPIALVVGTLFAVLVEVAVIRRLFNSPRVIVLVATIGIAELALAVASAFPSTGSTYTGYPVAVSGTWTVAGIQVTGAQLSTLVVVPIFGIALAWFLNRTTVGKTVQASSDNPDLARLSAISPKQVSTLVWAIAGLVGTVALILVAGQGLSASQIAQLGPDTLAQALVAAVIAGLRSFPRAVVAGAAIGILSSILNYNFINQPGLIDFFLFVAVLIAVWFQSRHADPDPQTYPTAPKGRVIPEYLKRVWWLRYVDKFAYALIGLVALVIPLIITAPSRNLLYATILAYAICATSLTVLTGWSGLLSLGQMAFAGLGALIAAALTNGLHIDIGIFWNSFLSPVSASIAIRRLHHHCHRLHGNFCSDNRTQRAAGARHAFGRLDVRSCYCGGELLLQHAVHIERAVGIRAICQGEHFWAQSDVATHLLLRGSCSTGDRSAHLEPPSQVWNRSSDDRRTR